MKKKFQEIFGDIIDWGAIVTCCGIFIYIIVALIVKIFF